MLPLWGKRISPTLATVLFAAVLSGTLSAARPAQADGMWSGFYVGANAGYAWGNANNNLTISDGLGINCHFCAGGAGNDAGLVQAAGSPGFDPKGFTGGIQLGYNWQAQNWVYGLEADFNAFSQKQTVGNSVDLPANTAGSNCLSGGLIPCAGNISTSIKTDWLVTVRPRVGYAWNQTLLYATGGLALTRLSFSQSYSDNVNFFTPQGGSVSLSSSATKVGWVVGGGIEHKLAYNWSLKAEYLYVRFDGVGANGTLTDGFSGDFANFTNNLDHLASNIVRFGVNYKFGDAPRVVTK
jgi:outer membrane immunogenic protein